MNFPAVLRMLRVRWRQKMSVKVKFSSSRDKIAVTVYRPFWQEFLY
jgi:hypothetical protein